MTALLWQTALLLLGAYFLGAFVGCMVRRTFFVTSPAARPGVQPDHPRAETAPVHAHPLTLPPASSASEPAWPVAARRAAEAASGKGSGGAPVPGADAPTSPDRFRRALTAPGALQESASRQDRPSPDPGPACPSPATDGPASLAPVLTRQSQAAAPSRLPAVAPSPSSSAPAAPSAPPVATADPLPPPAPKPVLAPAPGRAAAGISSTPVAEVSAGDRAPGVDVPAPVAAAEPARSQPAPPADDLTRIRSIDPAVQARLNALGARRFADIADWRKEDVRRFGQELGLRGRIEQENWIEQAQILARGAETAYSRGKAPGGPFLARPTNDEGERSTPQAIVSAAGARSAGTLAARSTAGAPAGTVTVAGTPAGAGTARRPVVGLGRDNLQRISHVSEEAERLLNVQGISRYEQVAHWSASDVTRFEHLLGGTGRISRENWIEQAQILAAGGETAYARSFDLKAAAIPSERPRPTQLAEAIRTATPADADAARRLDYSALRSVRSEALRAGAGTPAQAGLDAGPAERTDDLKRIRGIGVLIEKKLNGMGVRTYEQIANWTGADIARVSQVLDFRGRIERENWVEQARILASGGMTEFVRRQKDGED